MTAAHPRTPSLAGATGQDNQAGPSVFLDVPVKPGNDGMGFEASGSDP